MVLSIGAQCAGPWNLGPLGPLVLFHQTPPDVMDWVLRRAVLPVLDSNHRKLPKLPERQ